VDEILVRDGQQVRPGDVLLRVESTQAAASARARQAALDSAEAGVRAAHAAVRGARALLAQRQADLDKARFDWEKNQKLFEAEVISRQTMESKRSAFDAARAALDAARAQLASAQSRQLRAANVRDQARENLVHARDVLSKTTYRAPIGGTVTYIAARKGEDVIPGVPATPGAFLMTIVNLSTVNAEVRVNENNVVSLHPGQPAKLDISPYPGRTFAGTVSQVGSQAVFTNSGLATTQTISGSQQERDYKVYLRIADPPRDLRPGMTVTALIDTVHKSHVLAIPFQALLLRPKSEVGRTTPARLPEPAPVSLTTGPQAPQPAPTGVQGVFLVRDGRAIFTPVTIGILGEKNIEVRKGLQEGDRIVVGNFTALRQLHSGDPVKILKHGR
jgi:HlyD family secretion protein